MAVAETEPLTVENPAPELPPHDEAQGETHPATAEIPTQELPIPDTVHEAGPHQHARTSEIKFGPRLDMTVDDVIILDGRDLGREAREGGEGRDGTIEKRASDIRETIWEDARKRGYEDRQGLSITLGNGHRYVIRGVSEQQERRVESHKVGLPRFLGKNQALGTFGRKVEKRRERKTLGLRSTVHIPFTKIPNLDGSKIAIQRRETGLRPKFKETAAILVEEFDSAGDPVSVESRKGREMASLGDIYRLAGEYGVKEADWQERRDPSAEKQVVHLTLPGYASRKRQSREKDAPSIAQGVTAQLEARGIYNWEGLQWKRRTPSPHGGYTASDMTQEIVSDGSHKEVNYEGHIWRRNFIIRTTHTTPNGTTVSDKPMTDSELFHYLETGSADLTMSDMRLVRDKPDGQRAEIESSDPENHWRHEWATDPAPLEPIGLGAALDLMSYHQVYEQVNEALSAKNDASKNAGDKKAKSQMRKRRKKLKKNDPESVELAEELQNATAEMGIDRFLDVARDTHAAYVEELRRLGLEQSAWDYYSPSLIIRDMMKKRVENRKHAAAGGRDGEAWDPLSNELEARQFRNGLVDLYVGRRFGKSFTKLGKPMPMPTGNIDPKTKQPEHKVRRSYEPNEDMFEVISLMDKPRQEAAERRDRVWKPIEDQAELVFKLRTTKPDSDKVKDEFGPYDVLDAEEREKRKNPHIKSGRLEAAERELGRRLRRTIPPRAWYREVTFG